MWNIRFGSQASWGTLPCLLLMGACSSAGIADEEQGQGAGGTLVMVGTGGAASGSSAGGSSAGGSSAGGSPASGDGSGGGGGLSIDDDLLQPSAGGATGSAEEACELAILGDPGFNPAANFGAWIAERGPHVRRYAAGSELTSLSASQLAAYDVVLLDNLPPDATLGLSPEELSAWVHAGGRLVALSGYGDYPEALTTQNALLAALDLSFGVEDILGGPVTEFVPHPITQGLTHISFIGGREVQSLPSDEVLMTVGADARPVGVAAARGAGRAFLFGDEWVTFDSEWSSIPEIQQFWVNLFGWLGDCDLEPIIR